MKNIIFKALIFSAILNQAHAANVKKIEVFPPYINVGCSDLRTDSAGKLGLQLVKLTSTESAEKISLAIDQQLKVCTVSKDENGNNKLAWAKANPYKGFEVQYYDSETNSLKLRKEIIDSNSKFNRFELTAYSTDVSLVVKQNLQESSDGSAGAVLELNKNGLLNQNDFDQLDSGAEVKKVVILFSNLNTTSIVGEQAFEVGDQHFSGRNIALTFIKEKNSYKVKKISL